jgi:hypothetical protein
MGARARCTTAVSGVSGPYGPFGRGCRYLPRCCPACAGWLESGRRRDGRRGSGAARRGARWALGWAGGGRTHTRCEAGWLVGTLLARAGTHAASTLLLLAPLAVSLSGSLRRRDPLSQQTIVVVVFTRRAAPSGRPRLAPHNASPTLSGLHNRLPPRTSLVAARHKADHPRPQSILFAPTCPKQKFGIGNAGHGRDPPFAWVNLGQRHANGRRVQAAGLPPGTLQLSCGLARGAQS